MVKKCHFWLFYRFWISIFSKFEPFLKAQIYKNSKFWVSEIAKWQFLTFKFCQNWFQAKLSGKSMLVLWTLTSHFESFWSIVKSKVLLTEQKTFVKLICFYKENREIRGFFHEYKCYAIWITELQVILEIVLIVKPMRNKSHSVVTTQRYSHTFFGKNVKPTFLLDKEITKELIWQDILKET